MQLLSGALLLSVVSAASALNILLTNDDSWASANIRATWTALTNAGHDVLMVAPAIQQSGHGGTFILPTTNITPPGGEFGSIAVGAPFFGQDVTNPNLWYFNGTPAATAIFGIDVIAPMHFGNKSIDLVVAGPNEGQNNGPFLYTISGTIGATYASVERNIPGIAFSAGNGTHRSFTTNTGAADDPANIVANLTTNFVNALANDVDLTIGRLLPFGVGINVNFPTFGPGNNCTTPPFVNTRLTGGAAIDQLSLDNVTGQVVTTNIITTGVNVAYSGDFTLPGETVVSAGCMTAVSFWSVDYDAPAAVAIHPQLQLQPLFGKSALSA